MPEIVPALAARGHVIVSPFFLFFFNDLGNNSKKTSLHDRDILKNGVVIERRIEIQKYLYASFMRGKSLRHLSITEKIKKLKKSRCGMDR